jgi:serine/threonine-protein kinase HipA
MKRCPISYEETDQKYSPTGLKLLAKNLDSLQDFPYTHEEQLREAAARSAKMSIQGVQPKLSVRLNLRQKIFEVFDTGGRYILKPQNLLYAQLPENEDLTMKMAHLCRIEVPAHGLIYAKDQSLIYWIRRFDRLGRNQKLAQEDFAQLTGNSRDTKYRSSMEKVAQVIMDYCTFPVLDLIKLFRLTIFSFLMGNEDMHLKNFSLITRNGKVELSPAYDLINTTITLAHPQDELALPIAGKKSHIHRDILIDYYGQQRLGLNAPVIMQILADFQRALPQCYQLLERSFLSPELKHKYGSLMETRRRIIGIEMNGGI